MIKPSKPGIAQPIFLAKQPKRTPMVTTVDGIVHLGVIPAFMVGEMYMAL